ncbi:MAG: GspH/FimT family pseudopilin [Candidatus Thiodiazotropha sp.]
MQRIAYHPLRPRLRGLTLLEVLTTLVLFALILGIGVPAFNGLGARSRQTAEINNFVRHLQLARSSAVKTGRDHVLCPSSDMKLCREDTDWEQGYILFEDSNNNGLRDARESLVQISRPASEIGIDMRSTQGRKHVTYRADGRSAGSNLTLTFCDPSQHIPPKAVILSNTGRPRVATTRWDGTPLACAP